jgi:hypothetical protein
MPVRSSSSILLISCQPASTGPITWSRVSRIPSSTTSLNRLFSMLHKGAIVTPGDLSGTRNSEMPCSRTSASVVRAAQRA